MTDTEHGDPITQIINTAKHLASFASSCDLAELEATCRRYAIDPALANVQRNANFSMVEDLHNQLGELIAVAKKDFYN